MAIAVGVCFGKAGKHYWFDCGDLELCRGDQVVAETPNGLELGEVKAGPKEIPEDTERPPLNPVLRKADVDDLRRANENKFREQEAFRAALEKIAQYELPMKLIAVEFAFDRSKMVFHFVAESRVDFRELAKDLARTLRCRVELHQVGVRDEAKILGGLGPCGRELCCSGFLCEFEPVGIKMAKEQDLSLNPQKISGVCGRLMCCLAFEYPHYKEIRRSIPKVGSEITTPHGTGRLTEVDVVRQEVVITLEAGGRIRLPVAEVPAAAKPDKDKPENESEDETEELTAE